ncbi:MAG: ChbG/HpnK family deacetylase [Acidobacteria bacterium]|nr:ChbG/HpnK family deacetylase [Acidobacteriota bacterium]
MRITTEGTNAPSLRAQITATHSQHSASGTLIINADDWGRDRETTDRIFECWAMGSLSSASAMVYMEDSERSAEISRERKVDCGLHLNFTTPFSDTNAPSRLREHQERITRYLRRNKFARTVFHPGLTSSFEYVVSTQVEEFVKLFGQLPRRYDGHHHMHLCANVLFSKLIPAGTIVRRNFSFRPSEKGSLNRQYRKMIDGLLARRFRLTDYFFSLPPLEPPSRVDEILSVSQRSVVELETHPVNPQEYRYLTSELLRKREVASIARAYMWDDKQSFA